MSRSGFGTSVFLLLGVLIASPAAAQDSTSAAIEGHVFNAKTGQPLANANVSFLATNSTMGAGTSMLTDEHGFYGLEIFSQLLTADSLTLSVECRTTRGTVQSFGRLYYPLRPEVYHRSFYLTLPRGASKCMP